MAEKAELNGQEGEPEITRVDVGATENWGVANSDRVAKKDGEGAMSCSPDWCSPLNCLPDEQDPPKP